MLRHVLVADRLHRDSNATAKVDRIAANILDNNKDLLPEAEMREEEMCARV